MCSVSVKAPGCLIIFWITAEAEFLCHFQILGCLNQAAARCRGCSTNLSSAHQSAGFTSWCQYLFYYSCELQYILSSFCAPVCTSPRPGPSQPPPARLNGSNYFTGCRQHGLFISIWSMKEDNRVDFLLSPSFCLSPSLHPCSLEGLEPRAGPVLRGTGGGAEATDAAGGEETGACRGPLTKQRQIRCQDNHSTLRNG